MKQVIAALLCAGCLAPATVWAQTDLITTPPPNLVIGNYDSTSVGPYGGLEGAAYVARISDPSAAWFDPSGLVRQSSPQVSGSAGVYQHTVVAPNALPNQGGSIQQLPNYVGFTFVVREGVTLGASLQSTNAWDQETDSELFSPTATGQQRFAYSADSRFQQRIMAISVGSQAGPWRFGGGFAFSILHLRLVQSVSDRIADASGLQSLLVSARASGSAIQLRAQGGVQYDIGPWRFGGAVRSPGLAIHKTGTTILDGVLARETGSLGASLFDPDAQFEYHLPWEFQGGAAFVHPRFELEFDVQGYTAIDPYSLLSTDHPVLLYGDAGPNVPPIVTSHPFAGLTSASDDVVNMSVGGHVRPWKDSTFLIHAGFGSNGSPVAPAETVFSKVDFTSWSAGVSGRFGKFQFSAGWNHRSGNADDVVLRNLLNGEVVTSDIDVRVGGFIYSLAYQF